MGDKSFITKTTQLALCQLFRKISLGLKQLLSATELNLENRFLLFVTAIYIKEIQKLVKNTWNDRTC